MEYVSGTERLFSDNAALVRSGRLARTACARSGDDVTTGGDIPQKGHVASVVPLDLTACAACVEPIVGSHEHSGERIEFSGRLVLRHGLGSTASADPARDGLGYLAPAWLFLAGDMKGRTRRRAVKGV